jgi:flagellar assembly protein FliH
MTNQRPTSKFQFDTEFRAEGDLVSNAARARQRKAYSQDEIDQMCVRARAEGIKAGEVRALEAVAQATRDLTAGIRTALETSHDEIEALREDAARIALAMARKLAPAALDAMPALDVERALREALHQAIGEPRVTLRAAQRVVDALGPSISEIAHEEGYEGRVILAADLAIKGADCRIEWRGGGVERSEAAIAAAIADLIERRFSQSPQNLPTEG